MSNFQWINDSPSPLPPPSPPSGALGGVPARCIGMPGFHECHMEKWRIARDICAATPASNFGPGQVFADQEACIDFHLTNLIAPCVAQFCETGTGERVPPPSPLEMPWGVFSQKTKDFQIELNRDIREDKLDYCAILEDGKLGGATCGLARTVDNDPNASFGVQIPANCRTFDSPAICPGGKQTTPLPCTEGEKRDLTTGRCVSIECPTGQELVGGKCQSVVKPAAGKKKAGLGLPLLAGAFVVAAYIAFT